MERPDNCSEELYALMMRCWRENPVERPQFAELVKIIEDMLALELDYLDLDCLTGVSNKEYFMGHQQSPLPATIGIHQLRWDDDEEDNNDLVAAEVESTPLGYMNMAPTSQATDETVPLVQEQTTIDYLMPIVRSC